MNSWQIKLGSFFENWNAATLALSIKASAGVSERVGTDAGGEAAGGGSGQGGRAGCVPRFKMGGTSEQGGVLCSCDWATGGGEGPLSLAEADESAPGDELPPGTGNAMENVPIKL